jgi:hypothetical protein
MPREIPHAWKNTGAETGGILFIYMPASAGNWFEELCVAERPIDSVSDREHVEFNQRHGWECVGPSPF